MTRESRRTAAIVRRLSARLCAAEQIVVSHGAECGVHRHEPCSCSPIVAVYDEHGELSIVDDDGRRLHRLERS